MKEIIPTKNQLFNNFVSCTNWEEKYMYIMELGCLLPKFPEIFRIDKYFITGCQSYTWIALIDNDNDIYKNNIIKFYGYSDSAIVKGIIMIIFSIYHNLDLLSVAKLDIRKFLDQIKLEQHLTISRSQGVHYILLSISTQVNKLVTKYRYFKYMPVIKLI